MFVVNPNMLNGVDEMTDLPCRAGLGPASANCNTLNMFVLFVLSHVLNLGPSFRVTLAH